MLSSFLQIQLSGLSVNLNYLALAVAGLVGINLMLFLGNCFYYFIS